MKIDKLISKNIYFGNNDYCDLVLYRYGGNEDRPDIYLTVKHFYNSYDYQNERKEVDTVVIWYSGPEDEYEQIAKFVELVKVLDVYKP